MDEFALYYFVACALAFGGALYTLGNWFEDRRLRRDYEKARKEFHAALDRGEKRERAPVFCGRLGNMRVEIRDIVRTEQFRRQLAALKRIRVASEKQHRQ